MAEPGRYLVSDAGWFVCKVAGTATRSGKRWAYFDAGMFGGIIETTEGLQYRRGHRPRRKADSLDRGWPHVRLPSTSSCASRCCRRTSRRDDFVYIPNAGAYTTAYASNFNGFPLPEVRMLGSDDPVA
jgi:ornithine decarboxylase